MADTYDEHEEELSTVAAIYPEITIEDGKFVSIDLAVTPSSPLLIRFVPQDDSISTGRDTKVTIHAHVERDVRLCHLPPLKVRIELPSGYPADQPPIAVLVTDHNWLPETKIKELEGTIVTLWEEYDRCQIIFAYLDHLQQAANDGFELKQSSEGCLTLPKTLEHPLVDFDKSSKLIEFNSKTYDCGICLERKTGTSCYQLERCKHVFCRDCLQDYYNNAITEGDVAAVKCLNPECGKKTGGARQRTVQRALHPTELLAMGIDKDVARRYVEMKRKKRLESDKNTIYCPREHCKKPARSAKFPPIPADLADYPDSDSESEAPKDQKPNVFHDPNDRLAVCEGPKCRFAFCRTCYKSWHGPYQICRPRDPTELSAEEKASYDYIANSTSPCPECLAPTSKTHGCNHMSCFNCKAHFCYLCSAWLSKENPYQHFNKPGTPCYQKLFEMEEGDEGQGAPFAGARHWEQMAREVAREADEQEAREQQMQNEEIAVHVAAIDRAAAAIAAAGPPAMEHMPEDHVARLMGGMGRGRGNPFHPAAANGHGAGAAVRAHERGDGRGRGRAMLATGPIRRRAMAPEQEYAREEGRLQGRRFADLALRDGDGDGEDDFGHEN